MCKPAVTWSVKAIIFWLLIYATLSTYVLSQFSLYTLLYLKQTFSFPIDNHSMSFLKTFFSYICRDMYESFFSMLHFKKKTGFI